ncbi:hypothetical protein BX667DRAFT_67411 [Coemansia mojavensis]|nr:hypothetical protein BX667DRAFT_67411 [Coemansia mojavensis]
MLARMPCAAASATLARMMPCAAAKNTCLCVLCYSSCKKKKNIKGLAVENCAVWTSLALAGHSQTPPLEAPSWRFAEVLTLAAHLRAGAVLLPWRHNNVAKLGNKSRIK